MKYIITGTLLLVLSLFLVRNIQQAESATDSMDFEISASCFPHSEINLPPFLQLQYGVVGKVQGTAVESTLKAGVENYEQSDFKFGVPEKGWVSVIFPGPIVQAKLYCQNISDTQPFYFSADRFSKMKIFLSRDGAFSEEELASPQSVQKNELRTVGTGRYKNEFLFGKNTINPYWLQFGLPFSEPFSFDGHINFEIH